ncbi:hypothetical protein VN96_2625 [Lactococcus cremoris]|nr:hypothetical protein VN96_2625 [Lactococcus cremoris]
MYLFQKNFFITLLLKVRKRYLSDTAFFISIIELLLKTQYC